MNLAEDFTGLSHTLCGGQCLPWKKIKKFGSWLFFRDLNEVILFYKVFTSGLDVQHVLEHTHPLNTEKPFVSDVISCTFPYLVWQIAESRIFTQVLQHDEYIII